MEIGAKQLSHKVSAIESEQPEAWSSRKSYMSSSGDMKMSLRLMTCNHSALLQATYTPCLHSRAANASVASALDRFSWTVLEY